MLYDDLVKPGEYICHHGIKGQRWGIRRYQNPDGSLTEAGKRHYSYSEKDQQKNASIIMKNSRNIKKISPKLMKKIDPNKISMAKGWKDEANLASWDKLSKALHDKFKKNPSEMENKYYKMFPGALDHEKSTGKKISIDNKIETILDALGESGSLNKDFKFLGLNDFVYDKTFEKYYWEDVENIADDLVGKYGRDNPYIRDAAIRYIDNYIWNIK